MNFVAECTTIVAPQSIGRQRYGVAKVLSTMSGMRRVSASPARGSRSRMLPRGLPIVSPNSARVRGPMACSQLSSRVGSTKHTLTDSLRNVWVNWVTVPP